MIKVEHSSCVKVRGGECSVMIISVSLSLSLSAALVLASWLAQREA